MPENALESMVAYLSLRLLENGYRPKPFRFERDGESYSPILNQFCKGHIRLKIPLPYNPWQERQAQQENQSNEIADCLIMCYTDIPSNAHKHIQKYDLLKKKGIFILPILLKASPLFKPDKNAEGQARKNYAYEEKKRMVKVPLFVRLLLERFSKLVYFDNETKAIEKISFKEYVTSNYSHRNDLPSFVGEEYDNTTIMVHNIEERITKDEKVKLIPTRWIYNVVRIEGSEKKVQKEGLIEPLQQILTGINVR